MTTSSPDLSAGPEELEATHPAPRPIMPLTVVLTQVFWVRLVAVLFTCMAFSLAAHKGYIIGGGGDWCMFCWIFGFISTLLVLLVEQVGLQARIPVSWSNLPITLAGYAAFLCLSASFILPYIYLRQDILWFYVEVRNYRITSTVFSCLAVVAYVWEVNLTRAKPGQAEGYMTTAPGLLKVCQTFVAIIIFIVISNPVSYSSHPGLEWCMAVYCICFIVSMLVVILCVGEFTGLLPIPFSQLVSGYSVLAFLMYLSAVIVWPIFSFDKKYRQQTGDQPQRIGVAVLTAINLLMYLADLVYTSRLVFITK